MTDLETAIMIKNMARETVRRMSAAAKNAPEIVLKDVPKGATFIVRDFNNNIVASIAADKVTDETLNRWIRRGFKVAVKNAVHGAEVTAKNAGSYELVSSGDGMYRVRTPSGDLVKDRYGKPLKVSKEKGGYAFRDGETLYTNQTKSEVLKYAAGI